MSDRDDRRLSRRMLLQRAALGAAAVTLGGCDRLSQSETMTRLLESGQALNMKTQRLLAGSDALAPEYPASMISPVFRPNGSTNPQTGLYQRHLASDFADWRLDIDGLVAQPLSLSLTELRSMPARTQITRHDCVEGWSVIGQWSGPVLEDVLQRAGVRPEARYVVFHCMDQLNGRDFYYESLDMVAARHPQTILAHSLNGETVPVANGAPLRLRVERQLGYKMAKYLRGITLVEHLDDIQGGRGGYWEDRGYTWYAGV
ncbi:DMSO/TMAO reductase YedYZ molybdopterin-dependent catalytic subunit [Kushneria sinocarnis]|uniref:DMSO/TMAO reductase YedYZ molybdopterin-dependent catalytic subunit n=1 Tax=Kushneria sinocarnis TaxID=595502 RepID=A0A420WW29_9GAMM|nr:molybdopterin-binding protein [Kushneria sinocarnis]RKR03315.1 DMSO/TMAO reductase YedYZ molybdopterin-dependent catalytic subunit [Kushneria sinocarnis]